MTDQSQLAKRRSRALLFWLFIVCSVPLILLVIAYASGYRLNTQTGTVTEHALLSIESRPDGANVILNDVNRSDAQSKNSHTPYGEILAPGTYSVKLRADGYHDWNTEVILAEGKSAIFPEVILFKKQPATEVTSPPVATAPTLRTLTAEETRFYTDNGYPHPESLRLLEGPRTLLVDDVNDSTWLLQSPTDIEGMQRLGNAIIDAEWNPDQSELLFITTVEVWIYDLEKQSSTLLRRQSTSLRDATWHPSSGYVFLSDANEISAIEHDERTHYQRWVLSQTAGAHELVAEEQHLYFRSADDRVFDLLLFEE